jgi:hypothetical protein
MVSSFWMGLYGTSTVGCAEQQFDQRANEFVVSVGGNHGWALIQ